MVFPLSHRYVPAQNRQQQAAQGLDMFNGFERSRLPRLASSPCRVKGCPPNAPSGRGGAPGSCPPPSTLQGDSAKSWYDGNDETL